MDTSSQDLPMSLKIETKFQPSEGNPQQNEGEQKISSSSRRYDLRASRKSEIGQNDCHKMKAGHFRPTPVEKRLKADDPCDHGLRSVVFSDVGIAERDPRSLVERRIVVYRPREEVWYSGRVVRYDGYNKLHLVAYADGEEEWVSVQRDKIRLLEASTTLSKTPKSSNKRNSGQETKNKHGVVEKSGGSIEAVEGTSATVYRRKRKYVNISKQNDFDKENYGGIEQGKHGGANDIINISVIGGDADRGQKDSSNSLKRRTGRYKRIKKDSKQVEISGTDDLQKDDVGVGVVSDKVENAGAALVSDQVENGCVGVVNDLHHKVGVNEMRTTDGVVIHSCPEPGSFGSLQAEFKSKPVTRFTYQRRRQGTSNPLSSGRAKLDNSDAVVHQRPVDADSKTPNACEGTELVQPIQWLEELFIVEEALNIHMSPLSLRQPSHWQCVAHAMQLCKRGNLEIVKSQSLEDLMLVLVSVLHLCSASDKKSSSYPFMEHVRARILNSSESGTILAFREYFKLMTTLSNIDLQVRFVGNVSSIRQLNFGRFFQEIFSNVPENEVYVMGNRSMKTANLRAALESFSICFTSLNADLFCPLTRNSENIHSVPSGEDKDLRFTSEARLLSESSGGSAANDGTLALVPLEGLVNNAHDTDIINVSQQSTKNIYFSSPLGFLDHSENVCGGSHTIQSLQMSYAFAPSFFTNLHQRLSLLRNSYNELSLQPLPKRLPRSTISKLPRTKREYRRILVRSECNNPLVGKSWSVQAYSPLVSSSKNDCKDNRHYALPVLKFQKTSTDFRKWCCELNFPLGHGHTAYGGTRKRIHKKLKNPIRFCRVNAPNELLGNVNAVPFRSTRSARPARHARQCRQEKRSEKLNGPVMDFSKPGSELDSLSCTTNILIVRVDRGWRESDAEVTLKSLNTNEWTLDVKLHGFTRFTYKPQEAKICKTQGRITRVPGQVHNIYKSHITIWQSGGDWSLEFPNRHQWFLFKKLYKECYERNNGSFLLKHKDIPLPGVYLLDNDSNYSGPFARPLHYIKAEDEVRNAISRTRVLYDMDSDDERWLCQFNNNASDKISDETFERIINELEKLVFVTQPHLTINHAVRILSDLIPVEVLRSIYSYWEEKRNKKGITLVRQFQLGISKQTLSKNSSVQSSEGKQRQRKQRPDIGPPSNRTRNQGIGVTGFKITLKNQGIGMQHGRQEPKAKAIPFGNESLSHSLGPISYINSGLQKDTREIDAYLKSKREICAATQKRVHKAALQGETQTKMEIDMSNIDARVEALRDICTVKRRRIQMLTQNFDFKAYIAGKALRNAEVKKGRPLCFGGSAIALELSTDGRANANTATRECSMDSAYWALTATGH